jgi:hypothetical protein
MGSIPGESDIALRRSRGPAGKRWNKLKITGERESIPGHYENITQQDKLSVK